VPSVLTVHALLCFFSAQPTSAPSRVAIAMSAAQIASHVVVATILSFAGSGGVGDSTIFSSTTTGTSADLSAAAGAIASRTVHGDNISALSSAEAAALSDSDAIGKPHVAMRFSGFTLIPSFVADSRITTRPLKVCTTLPSKPLSSGRDLIPVNVTMEPASQLSISSGAWCGWEPHESTIVSWLMTMTIDELKFP